MHIMFAFVSLQDSKFVIFFDKNCMYNVNKEIRLIMEVLF